MDELRNRLTLWAESPEEARNFLSLIQGRSNFPDIELIFVAKKSRKSRHNSYIGGQYYCTSNDDVVDVYEAIIPAPQKITDLVQWCTCDIMLSWGTQPYVVVEDTTHIVRMNLYQRFPRLARAASLGIPSAILQGTRGLDFGMRGDCWALYRYLQAFEATFRLHPDCPSIPFWYVPTEEQESLQQDNLVEYISSILSEDDIAINKTRRSFLLDLRRILSEGIRSFIPPDIPSINHKGNQVIVRVGAKPEKKSWRTKGSGQMDPYIGMILAAKYIYCYDSQGNQIKPLVVEFTYLPQDFWFFRNKENALYKRLPFEFADEVVFLG